MEPLIKGNFEVPEVKPDEKPKESEYKKKALESVGGSMVFVERELLSWDVIKTLK